MTHDELKALVRENLDVYGQLDETYDPLAGTGYYGLTPNELLRIAIAIEAAEREACADFVRDEHAAPHIADAFRARGRVSVASAKETET